MRQKPPANEDLDEDQILWRRVTRRVTPLSGRQQRLSRAPMVKKPVKVAKSVLKIPKDTLTSAQPFSPTAKTLSPVDLREGDRAGLDSRTHRRLFRGDVTIDRCLDLHGYTAARAEVKLQTFIEDAAHTGCRCILVITGKGAGVLKRHVPGWLKRAPLSSLVLALAQARQADGGSGAFYVLLRRQR